IVPTVDRGLREVDFWSIETAGDRPSMKSTSGLSIWPRNCRAYADRDSTYRRWPSAKIVSKARLDLPDPDSPVKTIKASRGNSSETFLRLCSRAPRTTRLSVTVHMLCAGPDSAEPLCTAAPGSPADHYRWSMTAPTASAADQLETLRLLVTRATPRLLGDTITVSDEDWRRPS